MNHNNQPGRHPDSLTAHPEAPKHSLGIDPGFRSGGIVLLEMTDKAPHSVVTAWAWTYRVRKAGNVWEVRDESGKLSNHDSLNSISVMVAGALSGLGVDSYTLTLEGLYLDSMKKASRIITLAESAGGIVGPLLAGSVGEVRRPLAVTWRGKVLRLGRTSAAKAAERAVKCAPLLAVGLGELGGNEHAAEALCIAYYGGVLACPKKR